MKLYWRRQKPAVGSMAFRTDNLGYDLTLNRLPVAHVRPTYATSTRELIGWYWYTMLGPLLPPKNTCNDAKPTLEDAMAECKTFVEKVLTEGMNGKDDSAVRQGRRADNMPEGDNPTA